MDSKQILPLLGLCLRGGKSGLRKPASVFPRFPSMRVRAAPPLPPASPFGLCLAGRQERLRKPASMARLPPLHAVPRASPPASPSDCACEAARAASAIPFLRRASPPLHAVPRA